MRNQAKLKHSAETRGEECSLSYFSDAKKKANKAERTDGAGEWSLPVAVTGITPVSSVQWGHFVFSSTTRPSDQPELSYKLDEELLLPATRASSMAES